jgi:hypothetical protein
MRAQGTASCQNFPASNPSGQLLQLREWSAQVNQPISKSSLTEAQGRLVELLQNLNFGRIEGLRVKAGEPTFEPAPRLIQKLKMGGENGPRRETVLPDFWLKAQTIEMLEAIARIGDGQVLAIEVKNGLCFSVEIEHKFVGSGGDHA